MKRITGTYETLGTISYFIPNALPPRNPVLNMDEELVTLHETALQQLQQLNEIANRLPNQKQFIKAYILKEALLSSAIEGIHTTLLDVFTQPLSGSRPDKETQLVLNYTQALETACNMIQTEGFPIVSRVILQSHKELMSLGEGDKADPGNFPTSPRLRRAESAIAWATAGRKQSVRVGNLIPPQAPKILELMTDLEKFINEDDSVPPLIKAGLAHVQFETIHPFLDGNGRIGRLLIVLMLLDSQLLITPILYPSYYFKKYRNEYYVYLDRVRSQGDFESWIKYFLTGIEESCRDAYKRAQEIEILEQSLKHLISSHEDFSTTREIAEKVLPILFEYPIISATQLSSHLQQSDDKSHFVINDFIAIGILVPYSDQQQGNKVYIFEQYMHILEKEYNG